MEVELDPSTIGQSFEKVRETISEAQMEELQAVGPLDQNNGQAAEEWLRKPEASSTGMQCMRTHYEVMWGVHVPYANGP